MLSQRIGYVAISADFSIMGLRPLPAHQCRRAADSAGGVWVAHWVHQKGLQNIEADRDAQSLVLYGLRGVDKTVLLAEIARQVVDREWIVARVEGNPAVSLREALGEALHGRLVDLARPTAGRRILKALKTAMSFKASYDTTGVWHFGLDLTDVAGGGANTGALEADLRKLITDLAGAA